MTRLTITRILGGIVAALGVMVIALGATIAGGKYGQTLQGGMLAAAGAGLVLAGMMAATSTAKAPQDAVPGVDTDQGCTVGTPATAGSNSAFGNGSLGSMNGFVMAGGGAALVGLAAAMMVPTTKYPASTFNGNPPPDLHMWGYQELPSEKALKTMVA